MKYLIPLIFLLPISANANDKVLHATGSYVLTNIFLESGMTKKQAFLTTLVIGAIKERFDNNTPEEHAKDMLANGIGAGGAVLMFRWEF